MTPTVYSNYIIALVPVVFYAGGFVLLTRNHLKHLSTDIKRVLRNQRHLSRRVRRIERRMFNGQ